MDARTRRGAVALCLALLLGLSGSVVTLGSTPLVTTAAALSDPTPAPSPTVVPDRYLVQTTGTPTGRGGSARANARARAGLLAMIARVGAILHRSYDATWSGVSITATPEQLERITAVAGVEAVFPVYELRLEDTVAFATETAGEPEPSGEPTGDPTGDPTTDPSGDPTGDPTGDPSGDPTTDPSGEPAAEPFAPAEADEASGPVAGDDAFTLDYLAPTALDVLADDTPSTGATLRPETLVLTGPGVEEGGARLHVEGRGTFTVAGGQVWFVSAAGWTGTLDPVGYEVTDTADATASASVTVTVQAPPAPAAHDDSGRGTAGRPVTVDVVANDTAGGAATLQDPCLPDGGDCAGTLAATDGEWAVAGHQITFTPTGGFVGPTAVTYRVGDELGRTAEAALTVTIHAAPTASDHTATTAYLVPVTVDVLDDPQPPEAAQPDPASLVLVGADDSRVDVLDVDGEGTYLAGDDGRITFTPVRGFSGETTPQAYEFTDAVGATAGARLVVTVTPPAAPAAADDVADALAAVEALVDVLANDEAHDGAELDPDSLCLEVAGDCVSATTGATGTWQVTAGRIAYTSPAGFTGTAAIDYRVADELGHTDTATLTVTVDTAPLAGADAAHTAYRVPVTVDVLANDVPGADETGPGTLDPGSVRFSASGEPELTTEAGHWAADPTSGVVTFTPAAGASGAAEATYEVTDSLGHTASATISVRVGAAPVAVDDATTTIQGREVSLSPLGNDEPGDDGADPALPVPFDVSSLVLVSGEDTGATLTTAEGVWAVDALGVVTFVGLPGFSGDATIGYRVLDANANSAGATITVTVTAVVPQAQADDTGVPARHEATIPVLDNDAAGDPTVPLDPASLIFTDPAATPDGTSLATPEGTWTAAAGSVGFTPAPDFHGATAVTTYRVRDANGTATEATVSVHVGALSAALTSQTSTPQNVTAALHPLADIVVGDDGFGVPGTVASASLTFGAGALDGGRTLVVQNEGTWRIDAAGDVEFDPESAFTGTAAAGYEFTDSFGNTVSAQLRVVVEAVVPQVAGDAAHTAANHAVTVPVLGNDHEGHPSAPLKEATLALVEAEPAGAGTWTVNADGTLTFTPATNFTGTALAQYSVLDNNNTPGFATVEVRVGALPLAVADTPSTTQEGVTLTVVPTANDVPGDDGAGAGRSFAAGSLVLTNPAATNGGKLLATSAWTLTVDAANTVRFTASWRFTGTVTTGYRVTDAFGNQTTASITVTVTPTPLTDTEKRLAAIGALAEGTGGTGVKVGVIDSGIDYRHPDLGGTTASTFPTARVTRGGDFLDGDADGDPRDCYGHGTHVAGLVGANGNPKLDGALGVAPKVTFGAYRVFDCNGVANTANIVAAMDQAYRDGMNVVNLSLGATSVSWPNETGYPLTQQAALMVSRGVVVVAAVGNTDKGLFTAGSPAVAPGVIAVAATNAAATRVEDYSAMGPAADLSLSPTLSAPGTSVYSTVLDTARDVKTGTSMAAPEVAGAVAEILRAKGWTSPAAGVPAKVAALLYASATPVLSATSGLTARPESVIRQGAGLLRLDAALTTRVTASPLTLKLGEGSTDTRTVTLANTGATAVTYRASAVTGTSAAASTSGTDRGNQTPDWAWGDVGFSASPSTVTVPAGGTATVKVTISPPSVLSGRVGLLYGGWVRFTASGAQTVSVPFVGVRGDYQDVRMLPRGERSFTDSGSNVKYRLTLPGLAYQDSSGAKVLLGSTRTFRPAKGDYPWLMYHLDYPASAIRLKATNQKTKKSYYAVLSGTSTQLGRQGRDEKYSTLPFYGIYKTSGGKLARVPSGTYTLKLRVLRPLGKTSTGSHWETYTSRTLKLSWK